MVAYNPKEKIKHNFPTNLFKKSRAKKFETSISQTKNLRINLIKI